MWSRLVPTMPTGASRPSTPLGVRRVLQLLRHAGGSLCVPDTLPRGRKEGGGLGAGRKRRKTDRGNRQNKGPPTWLLHDSGVVIGELGRPRRALRSCEVGGRGRGEDETRPGRRASTPALTWRSSDRKTRGKGKGSGRRVAERPSVASSVESSTAGNAVHGVALRPFRAFSAAQGSFE